MCSHGHLAPARRAPPRDLKHFNLSAHPRAGGTIAHEYRATPVAGSALSFMLFRGHVGNVDLGGALEAIPLTCRKRIDSCLQ